MDEKFAPLREQCLAENSMTIDDLTSGWHLEDIPEKNLCFHKCLMQKMGLIDNEGVIQEDKVAEMVELADLTDEEREKAVQCVKDIKKIEKCEDSHKIFACRTKSG